jgi:phosphoserine phosphatase RsbU/P
MLIAFVRLMESENGKFLFLNTLNNGTKVFRYAGETLSQLEKELVKKSLSAKSAKFFLPGQYIFDDEANEIGSLEKSYLTCPLRIAGVNMGAILLGNKKNGNYFDETDLQLAETFSLTFTKTIEVSTSDFSESEQFQSALDTVIENLYLMKENFDSSAQLSEMIKVSKMINSTLNLQSLLETIMESGKIVLKSESSSLMLQDPETGELFFNVISTEAEKGLSEIRIPRGQGIAGLVATSGKSEIVNDAQNDPRIFKKADETIQFVTRNLIAVPLLVRGKVIGVLEVLNSIGRDNYTKKDLALFTTFSEQAALAIHNRELIDSLRSANISLSKKVSDLSSVNKIGQNLLAALDIEELFEESLDLLIETFDILEVAIFLPDKKKENLVLNASRGNISLDTIPIRQSNNIIASCFLENRMIYTNGLTEPENQKYQAGSSFVQADSIIYPFSNAGECIGVLCLLNKNHSLEFEPDETLLLNTIGNQMVTALNNLILAEEQIQKKSYEKEIEITSSIQRSILPKITEKDDRYQLGVLSKPAKVTGGDFYDFWGEINNEVRFLIADVSGKSLPAAIFMAASSSILKTFGQQDVSIDKILYDANNLIYRDSRSGMFVTVFLAAYNPNSGETLYTSAGHNDQILFKVKEDDIELLSAKGAPLGVISSDLHGPFSIKKASLAINDILVLYTDGIVEAINSNDEQFGMERFIQFLKENKDIHPQEIAEKIYQTVTEFAGNQPQFDDFTLTVLKRLK